MLLDHTAAFTHFQPVDLLAGLGIPSATPQGDLRPRPQGGGLLPATLLETDMGFRQARSLRAGDRVQTLDGGLRDIREIRTSVPRLTAMVHVPAGALGNDQDMDMPSDTLVAVEGEIAERLFDRPVVVAKLISLIGYKGISTALPQTIARLHIEFDEEELVWAEGGLLLNAGELSEDSFYEPLSLAESRLLTHDDRETRAAEQVLVETEEQQQDAFFGLGAALTSPKAPAPRFARLRFDPIDLLFGRFAA